MVPRKYAARAIMCAATGAVRSKNATVAIARVVTPMYESEAVPLSAPRASLHLSGALPAGGVVVADVGPAGFWIARTLPTSFPGNVCVPATVVAGFAAAAGLVCALEQRPCVVVSDQLPGSEGIDDATTALLELAEREGLGVAVQLWGPRGAAGDVNDHVRLLEAGLRSDTVRLDDVAVLTEDTAELEEAVGPLVAWA